MSPFGAIPPWTNRCGGSASELGGFFEIATDPDTDGRLLGMIETVRGYARESGALAPARIEALLGTVQRGLDDKSYLAVAPQFLVTAWVIGDP